MSGCIIKRSLSSHWFLLGLTALHYIHWMLHVLVGILGECARHVSTTQTTWIVRASMPAVQYATTTSQPLLSQIFYNSTLSFFLLIILNM